MNKGVRKIFLLTVLLAVATCLTTYTNTFLTDANT